VVIPLILMAIAGAHVHGKVSFTFAFCSHFFPTLLFLAEKKGPDVDPPSGELVKTPQTPYP